MQPGCILQVTMKNTNQSALRFAPYAWEVEKRKAQSVGQVEKIEMCAPLLNSRTGYG